MRFVRLLLITLLASSPLAVFAQDTPACRTDDAVYRAFDFWVGSWDVSRSDGTPAGTSRIERAEDGCLVLETWTAARGFTGRSMNFVDPADGLWHQVWVDHGGNVLRLAGGIEHGAMKLRGEMVDPSGQRSSMRGTWIPLGPDLVRQLLEISSDDGATWSPSFDGFYRRTAP